jgi:hypothetical protein
VKPGMALETAKKYSYPNGHNLDILSSQSGKLHAKMVLSHRSSHPRRDNEQHYIMCVIGCDRNPNILTMVSVLSIWPYGILSYNMKRQPSGLTDSKYTGVRNYGALIFLILLES